MNASSSRESYDRAGPLGPGVGKGRKGYGDNAD